MNTIKFQVGTTYYTRSAADHDCIFRITVIKRTDKSIWITDRKGNAKRLGINVYCGVETVKPYGTYSMCAVIGADKPCGEVQAEPVAAAAVAPVAAKQDNEMWAERAVLILIGNAMEVARG